MTEINIKTENGDLTTDELKKFVQCIRDIEQNMPERHIQVLMNTPEKTVKEMEDVTSSVTPELPFKVIIDLKKQVNGRDK